MEEKALELALEEQRRDYDILHGLNESTKTRTITFLAAGLAVLTYLYTFGDAKDLKQRLFLPDIDNPLAIVLYVVGFLLLLGSIVCMMVALVKNRPWNTAYENDQDEDLLKDYGKYILYMHKRYTKISRMNGRQYESRRYLLNISFLPLVIGATILLLLKTLGG